MTEKIAEKIAVLDTSTARKIKWNREGNDADEVTASPRLLELLRDGYTVYIATTRTREDLSPERYDRCIFDLIPEERFFTANPEMDLWGANSSGLVDLWERVLTHFGIEIPEDNTEWGRSWPELQGVAADHGIVIR